MTTPTTTHCPRCGNSIVIEYVRLGSAMDCPHCLRPTVPEVPVGGTYPASGYQLTYLDFRRLIEDNGDEPSIARLLTEWFGFRVRRAGRDTVVLGRDGVPVDPLWLHLQIQSDSARQHALYQAAMSLWR